MNIQDEMQKIHHKFGVSEMANYKIEQFIENLIKEDRAEQLTLTDVGKGTELLPDFLYKDDYGIKIGYHGDTEVSKEWNEYLEKIR